MPLMTTQQSTLTKSGMAMEFQLSPLSRSLMAVFHSSQVEIPSPFLTLFVEDSGYVPDIFAGFTMVWIPRKGAG